jgi:hypothetical protein
VLFADFFRPILEVILANNLLSKICENFLYTTTGSVMLRIVPLLKGVHNHESDYETPQKGEFVVLFAP